MSDFVDEFYDQAWSKYLSKADVKQKSEGIFISNIVKEYPDMITIQIYHNTYFLPQKQQITSEVKQLKKQSKHDDYIHRSVRRSRIVVQDIIHCNNWDYWCTFTFNPKKVDRYNFDDCRRKMSMWLDRQKDLSYIVVPELHQDGAIHFHGLLKNYTGTLKLTGRKTKYGCDVYHGNYASGRNEFIKIDNNKDVIAKYMTKKYIIKDMPLIYGRKRYFCSRYLNRPVSHVNGLDTFKLWSLVKNSKPVFINDLFEIHHISKLPTTKLNSDQQYSLI